MLCVALVTLSACMVLSVHPIYTDGDMVFEPALIGTWIDRDDSDSRVEFADDGDGGYLIRLHDTEEDVPTSWSGALVRVGEHLFLDMEPTPDLPDAYGDVLIAAHLFFMAELNADTLTLRNLSSDWLKQVLEEQPNAIAHTFIEAGVLLTASTEDAREFLERHTDDPDAFGDATVMVRATAS